MCLIREISDWETKQNELTNHTTRENGLQVTRTIAQYNEDYSLLVSKTMYPSIDTYTLVAMFSQLRYLGLVIKRISADVN